MAVLSGVRLTTAALALVVCAGCAASYRVGGGVGALGRPGPSQRVEAFGEAAAGAGLGVPAGDDLVLEESLELRWGLATPGTTTLGFLGGVDAVRLGEEGERGWRAGLRGGLRHVAGEPVAVHLGAAFAVLPVVDEEDDRYRQLGLELGLAALVNTETRGVTPLVSFTVWLETRGVFEVDPFPTKDGGLAAR